MDGITSSKIHILKALTPTLTIFGDNGPRVEKESKGRHRGGLNLMGTGVPS